MLFRSGYPNDWGWSHDSPDLGGQYSREEYIQVLVDIGAEASKYPPLIGVDVFETGAAGDWVARGFESTNEVREAALRQPEWCCPIRLLHSKTGIVETMEMEEYLRAVVPAESYASWHMEELKAQAVAARSYAMSCIRPSKNYDVDDTARFQVYNPNTIHQRSDVAIESTAGLHLLQKGLPRMTEYKQLCGRLDCHFCKGKPGTLDKAWPDQMCQYGAEDMAQNGNDYRTILRHYYGEDSQFSDGCVS